MRERDQYIQLPLFGEGTAHRGQTERNLAEYSITLIADRAPKGEQIRRHSWESRDKDGRMVKRSWTIAASAGQTLPLGHDRDVYIVLMQMTLEQGNDQPLVSFSRNELVTRLGWAHTGGNYKRLRESLDRLAGVTVTAENLFVDAFGDIVPHQVFSIISDMALKDERKTTGERRSYIRWSDTMASQIRSGVLSSIDVAFYLSLSTPLVRRLFEYLNKKRYVRMDRDGTPRFRRNFPIRLMHLAHAHLFLAADRPSEARRQLQGAHDELIRRGFLSAVREVETRRGEPMLVYEYAINALAAPAAPAPEAALPPVRSGELTQEEAARIRQADADRKQRQDLEARITPDVLEAARATMHERIPRGKDGSRAFEAAVQEEARRIVSGQTGELYPDQAAAPTPERGTD